PRICCCRCRLGSELSVWMRRSTQRSSHVQGKLRGTGCRRKCSVRRRVGTGLAMLHSLVRTPGKHPFVLDTGCLDFQISPRTPRAGSAGRSVATAAAHSRLKNFGMTTLEKASGCLTIKV
ncbi:unnamed protein product, partial [Ectocarpus sp. 8 AP-2014]